MVEQTNSLSVFWLRKHKYLPSPGNMVRTVSGGIRWMSSFDSESSIGFRITVGNENNIVLSYVFTDPFTSKKEDINERVSLTFTRCHFGGKRYWFICPLNREERYCGRRVGVLYSVNKYFGCRWCANVAYSAQHKGGKNRWPSVSITKVEEAERRIGRLFYRGKPTRKYLRFRRLEARLKLGMNTLLSSIERPPKFDL